jgi:hypothetical protein
MNRHLPTEEPEPSETVERLLKPPARGGKPAQPVQHVRLRVGGRSADPLWCWGVVGLMLLTSIALGGLLYLIADGKPGTRPEMALTSFVGLLTALLGVLAGTPWHGPPV